MEAQGPKLPISEAEVWTVRPINVVNALTLPRRAEIGKLAEASEVAKA
jgi:hypothetical protein